jgi:calcineurin-like phosphoesterase family protein
VEVIDEAMISLWNQRVNHDDNVYILGDFCYRNEKSAEWYLSQLKGHKHLVLGSVPLSDVGMEWLLQRSLALLWSYSR